MDYHLATIIDGNLGGKGSLRAANAAACAQDVGKFARTTMCSSATSLPSPTTPSPRTAY